MLAASITPRKEVNEMLTAIGPRKKDRQLISIPQPAVEARENLLAVSSDGSASIKRKGGSYSAIV